MIANLFTKRAHRRAVSSQAQGLERLQTFRVDSANCTLLTTAEGNEVNEDIGQVSLFQSRGQPLIEDQSVFLTTPDGLKAEDRDRFKGHGETIRLWFLHDRIPRVVDVVVEERIQIKAGSHPELRPRSGAGFRVRLATDVTKQDNRNSLRFSHRPGGGSLPVYSQIMFDVFVTRTNVELPTEGAIPPWIEDVNILPHTTPDPADTTSFEPEDLVSRFKDGMRVNPVEDRTVHVSKPYLDERFNRGLLLELGYSGVLGLRSDEVGRTLHIKKPILSRTKDRRDPHHLTLGDLLILHYGSRAPLSGKYDYCQLVTEIVKDGLENITIKPVATEAIEGGMRLGLIDFSVNGFRFEATPDFGCCAYRS